MAFYKFASKDLHFFFPNLCTLVKMQLICQRFCDVEGMC